ncbi:MAG: hypothetical protein ACE5IR_09075 [bacterium]
MIFQYLWFSSFVFLCSCNVLFGQRLQQNLGSHGAIDWETMVIHATGNSAIISPERTQKLRALEKAKIAASQNLLEAIEKLGFNSETKIGELLRGNSALKVKVESAARKFTIVNTRSMSDMSVEIDIELPVMEYLGELLLPDETGKSQLRLSDQPLCPTCGQPWPEYKPVPKGVVLIVPSEGYFAENGSPYTGLIIDAREAAFAPVFAPKILNERLEEIYGIDYVDRETAIKSGVVNYRRTLKHALSDERAGPRPLIIQALSRSRKRTSNIMISNNDAILIHAAAHAQNFLRECRVVIVTAK